MKQDYDFFRDDNFVNARNKGQHYFFGDLNLQCPSWQDVMEFINYCHKNNLHIAASNDFSMRLQNGRYLKHVQPILDAYSKLDTRTNIVPSAHIYIGLTELSRPHNRHNDHHSNVFFWQIIGSTHWQIEEADRMYEYVLYPNSAIYIPNDMYHTVTSLSPRVGVSLGLDDLEKIKENVSD